MNAHLSSTAFLACCDAYQREVTTRALRSRCRDKAQRLLAEMESRLRQNDLRAARHKLRKILNSRACKLHALFETVKRRPRDQRPNADRLIEIADRMDLFSTSASPLRRVIDQTSDEHDPSARQHRVVYDFRLEDRACARLLSMALKSFARAHPYRALHTDQVLYDGGLPTACERLRQALLDAPEGAAFVHVDIRSFFGSIMTNGLSSLIGIPPQVIHRHLSVAHMRIRDVEREDIVLSADASLRARRLQEEMAPSGIAIGSAASPIVAELVMAHILHAVGTQEGVLRLITYSDNIGVVVRSRLEAFAVREVVLEALRVSQAGPFRPSKSEVRDVASGFAFLGYRWSAAHGVVTVRPSAIRHDQWITRFEQAQQYAIERADLRGLLQLKHRLISYAASKREWPGAQHFLNEHMNRLYQSTLVLWREQGCPDLDTVMAG